MSIPQYVYVTSYNVVGDDFQLFYTQSKSRRDGSAGATRAVHQWPRQTDLIQGPVESVPSSRTRARHETSDPTGYHHTAHE